MRDLASLAAGACMVIALTGCSTAAAPSPDGSASATGPTAASAVPRGAPSTAAPPSRPPTTPPSQTTRPRLDGDGTGTVIHRGLDGPEGMVVLPDGTLV